MAIPVISNITSIQSYRQYQDFTFQPFASGAPFRWESSTLPSGVTLDTPTVYAVTGVAATDVLTATGNTFANGDAVWLPELTGPTELAVNTIYFVRDKSGSTFKLAATRGGAVIDFTVDLSAGTISKVGTGAISGAATVAGVFDIGLVAINADGPSATLVFPLGIRAAPAATSGTAVAVELQNGVVSIGGTAPGEGEPLFAVKENDGQLLAVQFTRGGAAVDLGTLDNLEFGFKQRDPDSLLVLGGGAPGGSSPDVVLLKTGSGATTVYLIYISWTSELLDAGLSEEENDGGTSFLGLCELTWDEPNSSGVGPTTLTRTSQSFLVKVVRDLRQ